MNSIVKSQVLGHVYTGRTYHNLCSLGPAYTSSTRKISPISLSVVTPLIAETDHIVRTEPLQCVYKCEMTFTTRSQPAFV